MTRPRAKDRCTGDCCREFYLPLSPAELREAYELARDSQGGQRQLLHREPGEIGWRVGLLEDIELLFPMVVHLGEKTHPPGTNPTDAELLSPPGRGHYYRCKHLDGGDCTIYEHRPGMCRRYPYSGACNYVGCRWGKVRAKKETARQIEARRKQLQSAPRLQPSTP